MSLGLSCGNLYFPAEPRDNIVTLQWKNNDTPLEPNTSIIFKVKCTAPQLFHVVPRYGAILLADATGASVQFSHKATEITFGLREHHGAADDENGGAAGAASAPSTLNRASTARTSRAGSATPGGPTYQERFAVEYVMIKSEPLAFQQVFNNLADHAKLIEVVKNIWSLVASGAIPHAHLGVQASLNMKVYMENVVLSSSSLSGQVAAAGQIVVPPEARLVAPSTHDRQSRTSNRNTQSSETSRQVSEPTSNANSTVASSRRRPVDELRALKEEINIMRRNSGASPSCNHSPRNLVSPNTTASSQNARRPADSFSSPRNNMIAAALPPAAEGEDVMMKFNMGSDGRGAEKKGLRVYLVLIIMLTLYFFLLVVRRGAKHKVAVTAAGMKGDNSVAAKELSMQVSSRDLRKVEF